MITIKDFIQKRKELYDKIPQEYYEEKWYERSEWVNKNIKDDIYRLKAQLSDEDLRELITREIQLEERMSDPSSYFTDEELNRVINKDIEKVKTYRTK